MRNLNYLLLGFVAIIMIAFVGFKDNDQAIHAEGFKKYDAFNYRIIPLNETKPNLLETDVNTFAINHLNNGLEKQNKKYLLHESITQKLNDTLLISYGEVYNDIENDISLKLDSILNDSRCPTGVMCVWEGNAKIRLTLTIGDSAQHEFVLNTNNRFRRDTLVDANRYKLLSLIPYPGKNEAIELEDYKAYIIIEKQ